MELLIMLTVLAAGVAIGWLLASRGTAGRARVGEALRDAIGAEAADALERVQQQLVTLERGRVGSDAALQEQIRTMADTSRSLRDETSQLVTALRAPQVRGRWGEMQLERVVEAAGMTAHVDYVTQVSAPGDGATLRPDLVVRLAGGKQVVVDSKVAFSAYLEAMEARDERTHAARMRAHAKQLRQHVDQLAAKAYWERFTPTPEFVVCFVPADAFLDAALREDPHLLEHAFGRDIVLATPSTLVALLRTVAYTWRQEALAANAAAIHDLGRELYRRISTMGGHVERLGRSLSGAVSAYNDAVGSLERRVVSTARQMGELGVVSPDTPLRAPEPLLDSAVRPLSAAELVEPRLVPLRAIDRDGTSGS
ncbi:MAG: DNA recombination protein RmuC [Jatrophihabitantaceae bacterium]